MAAIENGWGWNPDSFAAVGTTGAALIAAVALFANFRQRRAEYKDRISATARAVWFSANFLPEDPTQIRLEIRNLTGESIRPTRLVTSSKPRMFGKGEQFTAPLSRSILFGQKESLVVRRWSLLRRGMTLQILYQSPFPRVVHGDVTRQVDLRLGMPYQYVDSGSFGVVFYDADGRRWIRFADGALLSSPRQESASQMTNRILRR